MSDMTIRPCPFCNGDACLYANYANRYRKWLVYVKCDVCSAQGKAFSDREDPDLSGWNNAACDKAIRAWNMRATDKDKNNK